MEMLPIKQQRFTRKRRREGSTGEGNETEEGMCSVIISYLYYYYFWYQLISISFQVGENKKKDKKEDDSIIQNQSNDSIDTVEEISNGVVANMETEKIDTK